MQFIYDQNAKDEFLTICDETYRYVIKARRHKVGDELFFRNLEDSQLYTYELQSISKKEANLVLIKAEEKVVESSKKIHLLWSVVDPKTIEKQLPYLNEMGVDQITFFYSEYSQKNFKLNFDKFKRVLINSSQQCGRCSIIKLDLVDSLKTFLEQYPKTYMLNFSSQHIDEVNELKTLAIGCEGGFSQNEIDLFNQRVVGLNSNLILRSETAITAATAKLIL